MTQQQEQRKAKKGDADEAPLSFEVGKVFSPSKGLDLSVAQDSARYSARKGQGGDRRQALA